MAKSFRPKHRGGGVLLQLISELQRYDYYEGGDYSILLDHNGLVLHHPLLNGHSDLFYHISEIESISSQLLSLIGDGALKIGDDRYTQVQKGGFKLILRQRARYRYVWPVNQALSKYLVNPGASANNCLRYGETVLENVSSFLTLYSRAYTTAAVAREARLTAVNGKIIFNDNTDNVVLPGIRNEIAALSVMSEFWKESPAQNVFVLRRELYSESGILISSSEPAVSRHSGNRFLRLTPDEFERAGDSIVLSQPANSSVGDVVRVSRRVKGGLILSIYVSTGYLTRLIHNSAPECTGKNTRCFLLNQAGQLIVHPRLSLYAIPPPVERFHIAHQEPLVTRRLVDKSPLLVSRMSCYDLASARVQHLYSFNLSTTAVFLKMPCMRLRLASVTGTNVFFGVVEESCSSEVVFCPCQIGRRFCLNCDSYDSTASCDCPCECDKPRCDVALPVCHVVPEESLPVATTSTQKKLPRSCNDVEPCYKYNNAAKCLGILSCQWCNQSTCESLSRCPGGVPLPLVETPDMTHEFPVPVVAVVCAFSLVSLALALACYHRSSRAETRRAPPALVNLLADGVNTSNGGGPYQDPALQNMIPHDRGIGEANPVMLAVFDEPVNPYHANVAYEGAAVAQSSDHGYFSTHDNLSDKTSLINSEAEQPVEAMSRSAQPPRGLVRANVF